MAVTPKLIVDVTIDDGEPITIKEGDTLTEVKYMENGEEVTAAGRVTVINFNYVRPATTPACIHDATSIVATAITPTSMIVDCSTESDSDVREIPFSALKSATVEEAQEPTEETEEESSEPTA